MFSLKDFIMKGIRGMVGQEPDYKVIEIASGWLDKGVLTESDLADIDGLLTSQNISVNENSICDMENDIESETADN